MALKDDFLAHQIFIQRLSGQQLDVISEYLSILGDTAKENILEDIDKDTLQKVLRDAIAPLREISIDNMADFAKYESEFSSKILNKYLDTPVLSSTTDYLKEVLISTNMQINNISEKLGSDKSLNMAYKQFGNKKADELLQILRDGTTLGLTADQIEKNIDERVAGLQMSQAAALADTTVNFAANVGRTDALENSDIEYVEWVLSDDVIEHTDYCLDHEGNIYEIDDGPIPPAHWGCQSSRLPYIPDEGEEVDVTYGDD